MTGTVILAMLGRRLEDEDNAKFPVANKVDAMNNGMIRLINLLDNDHLEELRLIENVPTGEITSGVALLSVLANGVIRNGIEKVYDTDGTKFLHLVDIKDLDKQANTYLAPSTTHGYAYVYGASLYLKPTSITDVDVWYVGKPDLWIPTGTPGDGEIALSAECPLNLALHGLVADMAEAELWKQDGKSEKSGAILTVATTEIQTLNTRAEAERKEELGRTQN